MDLKNLKSRISNDTFVNIQGVFKLTKTPIGYSRAALWIDRELRSSTLDWINSKVKIEELFGSYKEYDNSLTDLTLPAHFPARILSGEGAIVSGENIFMIFPECLGEPASLQETFGIEFIDTWNHIFKDLILPIVQLTFGPQTNLIVKSLYENVDSVSYAAALFHEIGHRVGPFKIGGRTTDIGEDRFRTDLLGELSTDSLLISRLKMFPEIALFVILQRLFWFGRRGFSLSPLRGLTNDDHDCWIGSLMWSKLRGTAITIQHGKYEINVPAAIEAFERVTVEIDRLAQTDGQSVSANIDKWMRRSVPFDGVRYSYPVEFRDLLISAQHIPEIFKPDLRTKKTNNHGGSY